MIDSANAKEIRRILMEPRLLQRMQANQNDYGEPMLQYTLKKVSYGGEIARSFGFDETVFLAIQVICDLSRPCFGSDGEEFLRSVDPDFSRGRYGRLLTEKLLHGVDPEIVNMISDGVESAVLGIHHTPEEKIVQMMEYGGRYTESLETGSLRNLFFMRYRDFIIERTAKTRVLTDVVVPEVGMPKRSPVARSEEQRLQRHAALQRVYDHCVIHPETLDGDFRSGWPVMPEQTLICCYIAGLYEDDPLLVGPEANA